MPPNAQRLIDNTFHSNLGKRDVIYMAKALLQLSDEMFEMRERIKALELALNAANRKPTGIPTEL